jgi:anti-sigma regulatory factor (Ser/Thr protein kinase)
MPDDAWKGMQAMEERRQISVTECSDAGRTGARVFERHYPANPRMVPEARREAALYCREAGVSDEDCAALDLALGEALANAVRHGRLGGSHGDDAVVLSIWIYHDSVICYVHDSGPGFDPPSPPYEMPLPMAEYLGGRGLPLMDMLSDALLVCREDAAVGGVSVYLIKRTARQGHSLHSVG